MKIPAGPRGAGNLSSFVNGCPQRNQDLRLFLLEAVDVETHTKDRQCESCLSYMRRRSHMDEGKAGEMRSYSGQENGDVKAAGT